MLVEAKGDDSVDTDVDADGAWDVEEDKDPVELGLLPFLLPAFRLPVRVGWLS